MKQAGIQQKQFLVSQDARPPVVWAESAKSKFSAEKFASVTDPKSGKAEKTEITRVVKNGANVDYNRRGVITKGAEIETGLGLSKSYQSTRQRRRNQRCSHNKRKSLKFFLIFFNVSWQLLLLAFNFNSCFASF